MSSLRALAERAPEPAVLALIDARRGEVFFGGYLREGAGAARELLSARSLAPEDLPGALAAGEGAARRSRHTVACRGGRRGSLSRPGQAAGALVPPDASLLNRVTADAICEIGTRATETQACEEILPDYRRRPDAEIALARRDTQEAEREFEGAER